MSLNDDDILKRNDFFATPIFTKQIINYQEINPPLIDLVYKLSNEDLGVKHSNILGWQSKSNLFQYTEFEPLRQIFDEVFNLIIKKLGYRIDLKLINAWANLNYKYSSNHIHDHPNSVLSGAYYLKVPEPVSELHFYDPRIVKEFYKITSIGRVDDYTAGAVSFTPREGLLVVFPSWLKHSVDINLSEEDRISLSFNYDEIK